VAAAELFTGPLQTTLAPDELVVAASFPSLPVGTGWVVDELARRHGDFALAGVMLTVTVDGDGTPTGGRAAYMSCAPTPVVVDLGPAIAGAAAAPSPDRRGLYDLVASGLRPTDDIHASGEYRRHLAATLTVRALDRALARARAGTGTTDQPSEVPV
jgi:carbon-monoxide dehydrogenase medium subunit